jgi:hypothetical protein
MVSGLRTGEPRTNEPEPDPRTPNPNRNPSTEAPEHPRTVPSRSALIDKDRPDAEYSHPNSANNLFPFTAG